MNNNNRIIFNSLISILLIVSILYIGHKNINIGIFLLICLLFMVINYSNNKMDEIENNKNKNWIINNMYY